MSDTEKSTQTTTIDDTQVTNLFGSPYNVILFNDDHHPYDLVVVQVLRAAKCTTEEAKSITEEAHRCGQSVAFTGCKERCEHVESILAGPPLRLATDIQPA